MENIFEVQKRAWHGKEACRKFRRKGIIPAVVYGHGDNAINLAVDEKKFERFLENIKGRNPVIELIINGNETIKAIIKSIQRESTTRKLLAVDFQKVHREEKIIMYVPVILKGIPVGVKAGGILDHIIRTIPIRGYPDDLPDHIEIDVTDLKLGHSIHISDLHYENIEFMLPRETPIVSVLVPKKIAEVVTPTEEIKEPEVITEKKREEKEKLLGEEKPKASSSETEEPKKK
jgi:large subunit ribosomal protein L25